jgi:hypothetical protein
MARFSWSALADSARNGGAPQVTFGAGVSDICQALGSGGYVYLATPYSKRVVDRLGRWSLGQSGYLEDEASKEVGRLKKAGISAFSPIVASASVVHATLNPYAIHPVPDPCHDPLDADAWLDWCMPFLWSARALVVPDLAGWDQSKGIKAEVMQALEAKLPVLVYAKGESDAC